MTEEKIIPLCNTCKGSRFWIVQLPEGKCKTQLVRLGISKGVLIKCLERLPGGTVVIEKNRREIAIGITLAKSIFVTAVSVKLTEKKSERKHE